MQDIGILKDLLQGRRVVVCAGHARQIDAGGQQPRLALPFKQGGVAQDIA